MVEQGIIDYLIDQGVADGQVFPLDLPQGETVPAVLVQRVSLVPTYAHEGATGLEMGRFQFTCWADTYLAAKQTAEEVKNVLSGYKGLMGDVNVGASFVANEADLKDPDTQMKYVIVDALIWSNE